MERIANIITNVNRWVTKVICIALLMMLFSIIYEVVSRYFLNSPSKWSNEISQYLLVVTAMLGGGFCFITDSHVRVDILYHSMSLRSQLIVNILTTLLVIIISLAIILKGGVLCYDALLEDKRSNTVLSFPLFPSMVMVPLGALLLALQAIANLILAFVRIKKSKKA